MARTISDILKKVAPDLLEGKTCEKEDLCRDIVKKLGKREQKWAVALISEQCKILNDSAKSELAQCWVFLEMRVAVILAMKVVTK